MLKELKAAGLPCEAVERHSRAGGLWDSSNPESPAYDSLQTNSSKFSTHLGDPLPAEYPEYISKDQALQYLLAFAERHDLNRHIRFKTSVESAEKTAEGHWRVKFKDLSAGNTYVKDFRAVVASSGHQNKDCAKYPQELWNQARSAGIHAIHSISYRNPEKYKNQNVLIIGIGNSAADIAIEVSRVAKTTAVAVRSTPWIVPLWFLGVPADRMLQNSPQWAPHWIRNLVTHFIQRTRIGHPTSLGLPAPDHKIYEYAPLNDRGFAKALRQKRVQVRPEVEKFDNGNAHFKDGSVEPFDAVIFATGYRNHVPYLSKTHQESDTPPFLLFNPQEPGLIQMVGFATLQGGWPLFAEQAKVVAAYFAAGTPKFAAFRALLKAPQPDMKGPYFRLSDDSHVAANIYSKILRQLSAWLKSA